MSTQRRPFTHRRYPLKIHASDDIVGWHVAKIGDRWAALEPIRAGARLAFGAFAKDVARGLTVRSDWGPQYIADAFRNELAWLGITHSHSCVREPQCNGVLERFIRTLKEQCLWLHRFESLEDARVIIGAFIERYNQEWLIERLDHRTPVVARQELLAAASLGQKSCLGNRVRYGVRQDLVTRRRLPARGARSDAFIRKTPLQTDPRESAR